MPPLNVPVDTTDGRTREVPDEVIPVLQVEIEAVLIDGQYPGTRANELSQFMWGLNGCDGRHDFMLGQDPDILAQGVASERALEIRRQRQSAITIGPFLECNDPPKNTPPIVGRC